ncbi:MAG: hypothetical protein IMZ43_09945 [Thermoplasmata archaeon]|nr:hypothetical protein [Thermoplasmata archaeon]
MLDMFLGRSFSYWMSIQEIMDLYMIKDPGELWYILGNRWMTVPPITLFSSETDRFQEWNW